MKKRIAEQINQLDEMIKALNATESKSSFVTNASSNLSSAKTWLEKEKHRLERLKLAML